MNIYKLNVLLKQLKDVAIIEHYYCDDCWYTCPKHPEGCCDDSQSDCNCGADAHNEKIENLYKQIRGLVGDNC